VPVDIDSSGSFAQSSHLTIGRFINSSDFADEKGAYDPQKMETFISKIEEINRWLEKEFWPEHNEGKVPPGADWLVGEEKGLNCRKSQTKRGRGRNILLTEHNRNRHGDALVS
jgi:vesicle-fusing ATPase